jgi:GMP synthase (glutamine-hydrolysing)
MKNCLALRHVSFENIGILEPLLRQRGCEVRYLEVGVEEIDFRAVQNADLLGALGGPIGVYEEEAYPFIIPETAAMPRVFPANGRRLAYASARNSWLKPLAHRLAPDLPKK